MPKTYNLKSGLSPEQEAAVVEAVRNAMRSTSPYEILGLAVRTEPGDTGGRSQTIVLTGDIMDVLARAAIAAHTRALEGVGWRLVPAEPTEEMLNASAPAFAEINDRLALVELRGAGPISWPDGEPPLVHAWRAMIAAAPPQRDDAGEG